MVFALILAFFLIEGALMALCPVRVRASLGPTSTFEGQIGPARARLTTPVVPPASAPGKGGNSAGGGITGAVREVRAFGLFLAVLRRHSARRRANVRLEGGVGDPALGALLMGSAAAVLAGSLAAHGSPSRLAFRPDLIADEVRGRGDAEATFPVAAIIPATLAALRALKP